MTPDDVPWRQSAGQRRADDLLEEWAGESAPPPRSAYPAEWQMPDTPAKKPRRRRGRRNRDAAGTAAEAVVVRKVRSPRQEFPLPDADGLTRSTSTRTTARPASTRSTTARPTTRSGNARPVGTGSRSQRARNQRPQPTRSRSSLVGSLIGVGVVIGAGVLSALGNASSGGGSADDIAEMGADLSPYGLPIDLTDLGVVPADEVFTFDGDPDRWDSAVAGWRTPGEMIRVYLDPELTVAAPDAWVGRHYGDEDDSALEVSPSYDTVLSVSGGDDDADIALGERWGAAAEYYIAQLADLDTGEPLDRIPVQRFEVRDLRPRPVVTAEVDSDGVLRVSWDRVDGATRYDVLDTSWGFGSLGRSDDLDWTSDQEDTPDGYRQNQSLAYLSGVSADSLAAAPDAGAREVSGLAVSALLQGGRIAVTPVDSAVLAAVPQRQASTAWSNEGLYGHLSPDQLPGALPYEMADGSTALLPVSYDTGTIAEIYDGAYAVRYTVHGARSGDDSPLTVDARDRSEAVRLVTERNAALDAQRDPSGPPQPYDY